MNFADILIIPKYHLKTTQVTVINVPLQDAIVKQYGSVSQKIINSLYNLQTLRYQFITQTNLPAQIRNGTQYFYELRYICNRLDLMKEAFTIEFSWTDTFAHKKEQVTKLLQLELANVAYNLAVLHMRLSMKKVIIDVKESVRNMRIACYYFEEIQRLTTQFQKNINLLLDMSEENLKIHILYCQFMIQYLSFNTAKRENKKYETKLKIGSGVNDLAVELRKVLEKAKNFDKALIDEFRFNIKIATLDYQTEKLQSEIENEVVLGQRIGRAKMIMAEFETMTKLKHLDEEVRHFLEKSMEYHRKLLKGMEKENKKVKSKEIDVSKVLETDVLMVNKSACFTIPEKNAFRELAPNDVARYYKAYLEQTQKAVKYVRVNLPKMTQEGEKYIRQLRARELVDIANTKVDSPKFVQFFTTDFKKNQRSTNMSQKISNLDIKVMACDMEFTNIDSVFDSEAVKDTMGLAQFKNEWKLPLTSKQSNLVKKLDELLYLITVSKKFIDKTKVKFNENKKFFDILENGKVTDFSIFPPYQQVQYGAALFNKLETLVDDWDTVLRDRYDLINAVLANFDNQETKIIARLMGTENKTEIINKFIRELNMERSQIDSNTKQQRDLLKQIGKLYTEIQEVMGDTLNDINKSVDKVNGVMIVLKQIDNALDTSFQEYQMIEEKMAAYEEEINDFCGKHAKSADEIALKKTGLPMQVPSQTLSEHRGKHNQARERRIEALIQEQERLEEEARRALEREMKKKEEAIALRESQRAARKLEKKSAKKMSKSSQKKKSSSSSSSSSLRVSQTVKSEILSMSSSISSLTFEEALKIQRGGEKEPKKLTIIQQRKLYMSQMQQLRVSQRKEDELRKKRAEEEERERLQREKEEEERRRQEVVKDDDSEVSEDSQDETPKEQGPRYEDLLNEHQQVEGQEELGNETYEFEKEKEEEIEEPPMQEPIEEEPHEEGEKIEIEKCEFDDNTDTSDFVPELPEGDDDVPMDDDDEFSPNFDDIDSPYAFIRIGRIKIPDVFIQRAGPYNPTRRDVKVGKLNIPQAFGGNESRAEPKKKQAEN